MTKFLTFKLCIDYGKIILSVFAIVGTFYAVFSGYRNFVDNQKDINKNVNILMQNDTVIFNKLIMINQNIEFNQEMTHLTKEKVDALEKSWVRFLRNNDALSKEDFIDYMMGLELTNDLKKNEIQYPLMTQQK